MIAEPNARTIGRRRRRLLIVAVLTSMTLGLAACTSSSSAPVTSSTSSTPTTTSPAIESSQSSASSPSAATTASTTSGATSVSPTNSVQADAITAIVQTSMTSQHLRAVIVKVTKGDQVVINQAFGESLDGVPATTQMHFRNGAVAFAYLGTLLLLFVDQHKVTLDDTIQKWEPTLPNANKVTLKMLANQTTGYPDFETDDAWTAAFNANPFQSWTYQSRIDYALRRPMQFAPGTNWSYAHTNFMILGDILAKIGGKPLATLLQDNVLTPMGLTQTTNSDTGSIPDPVLHAFSSERRAALGIPAKGAFYEESSFWNSNWGVPVGANESTTVDDLITTAVAVGTGKLLSKSSFQAMTGPNLLGFGHKLPVCGGSCFTQVNGYNYGLGIVRSGNWIIQNPLLGGYSATEAYLPSQKIAIAVAVTYLPGAFGSAGLPPDVEPNSSNTLFQQIGAAVAPKDAPPTK